MCSHIKLFTSCLANREVREIIISCSKNENHSENSQILRGFILVSKILSI